MRRHFIRFSCAFCSRVKVHKPLVVSESTIVTICAACFEDYKGVNKLYHEILRIKPQYASLSPSELLRKLWEGYCKLAKIVVPQPQQPQPDIEEERQLALKLF